MPKFPDLPTYAAAIAPVIDAVHVNVHASARRVREELDGVSDVSPGFLNDLRFTLPLRPLTRDALATVYRYGSAAEREAAIQDHLEQGILADDGEGLLRVTDRGLAVIHRLYRVHAAAVQRIWPGHDVPALAALAGRVLDRAQRDRPGPDRPGPDRPGPDQPGRARPADEPGSAFALVAPPYEPQDAPAGVLLFNRLAALRYHRADAHAAAWREAGLSVAEIVALKPGPARERIETGTNRRAAQPYRTLTDSERDHFYGGLLHLM
ncbi:hypothetical protein [Nonomuraea sp. LPB2021202275-12-8]|uniref:hypothetical protein n=1 Tax=Nonomuraea sp. LPB2021202275-12-8 TaxID=3120159 RepID=UPI00300D0DEF